MVRKVACIALSFCLFINEASLATPEDRAIPPRHSLANSYFCHQALSARSACFLHGAPLLAFFALLLAFSLAPHRLTPKNKGIPNPLREVGVELFMVLLSGAPIAMARGDRTTWSRNAIVGAIKLAVASSLELNVSAVCSKAQRATPPGIMLFRAYRVVMEGNYFSSWEAAVDQAGFSIPKITRPAGARRKVTADMVISAIQGAVRSNLGRNREAILSQDQRRDPIGLQLFKAYNAVVNSLQTENPLFPSWKRARSAAGDKPKKPAKIPLKVKRDEIIKIIQEAEAVHLKCHRSAIYSKEQRECSEGAALYTAYNRVMDSRSTRTPLFPSWNTALRAANAVSSFRKRGPGPTHQSVILMIQEAQTAGLNTESFKTMRSEEQRQHPVGSKLFTAYNQVRKGKVSGIANWTQARELASQLLPFAHLNDSPKEERPHTIETAG